MVPIYQINCKECNFIYNGKKQLGTLLLIQGTHCPRLNRPQASNVAKHILKNNHNWAWCVRPSSLTDI